MKITNKSDYAIKALLDLSYKHDDNRVVPIVDISTRQHIPEKFLEQIMLTLKRAGLVTSRRGVGGGFLLGKKPQDITIGEVIRLVDGPVEPDTNLKSSDRTLQIQHEDQQAIQEVWVDVTHAISNVIDRVTFADIMCRADELRGEHSEFNYII